MMTHLALAAGEIIQSHCLFHWMFLHRHFQIQDQMKTKKRKLKLLKKNAQNLRKVCSFLINDGFKLL